MLFAAEFVPFSSLFWIHYIAGFSYWLRRPNYASKISRNVCIATILRPPYMLGLGSLLTNEDWQGRSHATRTSNGGLLLVLNTISREKRHETQGVT